jgi:hypothetical protein
MNYNYINEIYDSLNISTLMKIHSLLHSQYNYKVSFKIIFHFHILYENVFKNLTQINIIFNSEHIRKTDIN